MPSFIIAIPSAGRRMARARQTPDVDSAAGIERSHDVLGNLRGCGIDNNPDHCERHPARPRKPSLSAALHVGRDRLSSLRQCPLCVGSVDDRFAFKQRVGANGILGRQSLIELSDAIRH